MRKLEHQIIREGQVWEDKDARLRGRRLRVLEVGTEFVHLVNVHTECLRTKIRRDRLRKYFRLIDSL